MAGRTRGRARPSTFVRDEEEGYIAAKRSADGSQLQFTDGSGSTVRVKQSRLDRGGPNFTIALSSPSVLGLAFDDLVNLDELNEATILHSLRVRFERDRFYTSVGTILVALNPFKWVHELYAPSIMDFYRDNRYSSFEKPPHVFDLAERSFYGLLENAQDHHHQWREWRREDRGCQEVLYTPQWPHTRQRSGRRC